MWKGVEAAVNLSAFPSGTTMASHPSESDVRVEGINVLPLIGMGVMYMKASDCLRYNQKRVKSKHNGHLLVYPGTSPLEIRRYTFFLPIAWLVGCVFYLILQCTRFLVEK